jgi:polar amino acid transport system substrate-binding protein
MGGTVDTVADDVTNAKRLESGEIDLWVTGYQSGLWNAKNVGVTDLEEVLAFREDFGYLALNPDTKLATVLKLNEILDEMKAEGLLDRTLKFK